MTTLKRAFILALSLTIIPAVASAGYRSSGTHGDLELAGHIRTTNIIRHRSFEEMAFIMQRNSVKLRLEWKWLKNGKAFGRNIPWLKRSDFFMLARGVYDSIYDIRPGQIERENLRGVPLTAREVSLDTIDDSVRDRIKWQFDIREAYFDFYFKKLPLHLRIGKQQVVWGETDGFRMLDRANPLDLSWHFFQELPPPGFGFDEIRIPMFMIKALWDFDQIGNLSQPFLEVYWNPGFDWVPGRVAFLPRPWGVKLLDPIFNSAGDGILQTQTLCSNANSTDPDPSKRGICDSLKDGTTLFNQGDYQKNPLENSQFGVRFHFITEGGFEWTLNYLYQRASPDGSPTAPVRGVPLDRMFNSMGQPDPNGTVTASAYCDGLGRDPNVGGPFGSPPWAANQPCITAFSPYIHTIGASLNWFEAEYTQTVWRLETIIDFDLPFLDGDKQVAQTALAPGVPPLFPGISKRSMWKGMLAFDRPTWIKSLNKKTTFFITGQLFWHHIINFKERRCFIDDDPSQPISHVTSRSPANHFCGNPATGEFLLPGESWGLIGPLDLPSIDDLSGPRLRDTIHEWEVLGTLAILGFYRGGTLVPAMIYLIDPINAYSQELAIGFDWFVIPDLAFNLTTRLIWAGLPWDTYGGLDDDSRNGLIFDPWFLAGGSRGRSETSFQLTWQF